MKICVIGTGYVGLVAGTCLADMGNNVICVDKDKDKLKKLEKGIIPIYEPELEELIHTNVKEKRLTFNSNLDKAIKKSQICFIAVGTPMNEDGSANLKYVFEVAKDIAKSMNGYKVIANKSTVPVGTGEKISQIIKENTNFDFDVVSNPEFLKQGNAVEDFLRPDRIIIGSNSKKATNLMMKVYEHFVKNQNPVIVMDVKSAEMTKYAANSFLAVKISFINEIANICEAIGADIDMVRYGMCSDSRIGKKFLYAGLGYGGSCFPKDIQAMIQTAYNNNCVCEILNSVDSVNKRQRLIFLDKILKKFNNNLKEKTIAIWGLAFKPKTNDMREAPAITIINALLNMGAKIVAYDPKAFDNAKLIFKNKIKYAKSSYDALKNADCMVLLTEWNEFRNPDFEKMKTLMKTYLIFDGRNQYDKKLLKELGFEYICVGKK